MVRGSIPDLVKLSMINCAWTLGLGAEKPLAYPPWLVAVDLMTARMSSPSLTARESGFSSTAPTPSAGRYPSPSPKLLLSRRLATIPARLRPTNFLGCRERLTTPATARAHSPCRRLWHATCKAVREEEHMVSMARLGPCKWKKCETRLA